MVKLNCCCWCSKNIDRLKYCKSYGINSYEQFLSKEDGVLVSEMKKEKKCSCCSCDEVFNVRTMPDNCLAGIIKFDSCKKKSCCSCICCGDCKRECCKDYYYCFDILSPNLELIYTVYLLVCCCKCLAGQGWCESLDYTIKNAKDDTVGRIKASQRCCTFCGLCAANYSYKIKFPENATVQMKLTLINAVILHDLRAFLDE